MKIQLLINHGTLEIISVAIGKGKEHDFQIFKKSKVKAVPEIEIIADKRYQGIKNYHANSKTPAKKPRKGKLNPDQKRDNRNQAQVRIKVEQMIRCLKIFRILSSRYRNRRKRFGLRVNLIAGIYNYELKIAK
jgi:IS5 family transposase